MESKYTPGPWTMYGGIVSLTSDYSIKTINFDTEIAHIKICQDSEANARLIAAAPDLLEACKRFISKYGTPTHNCTNEERGYAEDCLVCEMEQAISKAEGKS